MLTRSRPAPGGRRPTLQIGDVVEVRSAEEILATLDERGELDALPFMPEMLQYSGQRFTVFRLADKLCHPAEGAGLRRMDHTVILDQVRCDGGAHGGCQAACSLFWKEAWLRPADAPRFASSRPGYDPGACTTEDLFRTTRKLPVEPGAPERFSCQATELLRAAPSAVKFWDLQQYLQDYRSGAAPLAKLVRSVLVGAFNKYQDLSRRTLPAPLRIRQGRRYPFITGQLDKTPHVPLGLRPGDAVEIKSRAEIVATLNCDNRTRGLSFDPEMLQYCGQPARVAGVVHQLIDECSGEMLSLKNPCIILDGVVCEGEYHRYCAKTSYPYWRETWLRAGDTSASGS